MKRKTKSRAELAQLLARCPNRTFRVGSDQDVETAIDAMASNPDVQRYMRAVIDDATARQALGQRPACRVTRNQFVTRGLRNAETYWVDKDGKEVP